MTDRGKYRDTLLIEFIAKKAGFSDLSTWLFETKSYGAYLFVAVGLLVEYGIFDMYNYFITGKSSFITSPNSLAIPAMTILGVFGLQYIHDGYDRAVLGIGVEDTHTNIGPAVRKEFEGLVSFPVRLGAYGLALISYYAFITIILGIPELIEIGGIGLVLWAQLVTFPLIIIPVLTELAISYIAVHFLVPRRIRKADLGLFFYDPRDLGGFEPIGELLKRSYYIYTGILLLWFLQTHLPVLLVGLLDSPYPPPGPIYQIALSAIWVVGVLTIGYSMIRIHRIMSSKKADRVQSLEDELKSVVENPYDATPENIAKPKQYEKIQTNLEQVKLTKTYPTTFAMWSQIFLSVLLPQALNMVVQLPQ